ncbi:hypothetical protein HYV83_01780 [Candidatus Woesearchaeota archaeon]|nr:hypothetical protein [Candidatus Woesearchaeota archaeon]
MKINLSKVSFSRNDIRLGIRLSRKMNSDLAYLLGVQIGDGYLKKVCRGTTVDYRICIDGHSINDKAFFSLILKKLIKSLFNKDVKIATTSTGTVQISFCSKAIFTFLNQSCEIPESPKTNIVIPSVVLKSSSKIKRAFLRGLADTDFSLTFKKRVKKPYYPVIYYQTSCQPLYDSARNLLDELGFSVTGNYRKNRRYEKFYDAYYLQISGRKQLDKWMKEIGFLSFNNLSRYESWKKLGRLPALNTQ